MPVLKILLFYFRKNRTLGAAEVSMAGSAGRPAFFMKPNLMCYEPDESFQDRQAVRVSSLLSKPGLAQFPTFVIPARLSTVPE